MGSPGLTGMGFLELPENSGNPAIEAQASSGQHSVGSHELCDSLLSFLLGVIVVAHLAPGSI